MIHKYSIYIYIVYVCLCEYYSNSLWRGFDCQRAFLAGATDQAGRLVLFSKRCGHKHTHIYTYIFFPTYVCAYVSTDVRRVGSFTLAPRGVQDKRVD